MRRNFIYLVSVSIILLFSIGCTDSTPEEPPKLDLIPKTFEDLHAPQSGGREAETPLSGPFVKFSFREGAITTNENKWDIAFRGTTILVNGGTKVEFLEEPNRTGNAAGYIQNGVFEGITSVTSSRFKQDSTDEYAIPGGSDNGWYNYVGEPTHVINPIPGKILIFRTHDNRFVKMEILSYYKGAPEQPIALGPRAHQDATYTFRYVYQPNEDVTTFD